MIRSVRRWGIALCLAASGCSADRPLNPSFPLRMEDARAALRAMEADRKPFERPVVVVGGYLDPGIAAHRVARRFRRITTQPEQVIEVVFWSNARFETCRARLVDKVRAAFPCDDSDGTVEVDVVGISMGGLVAMYAALEPSEGDCRLRIRRLFTIATPHQGARLASLPTLDRRQIEMRRGSGFLGSIRRVWRGEEPIELIPYVRLGDVIVGSENAAPEGEMAWWVANPPFESAHLDSPHDARITADIARRLRGEAPFTMEPRAPLPDRSGE